MIAVHALWSTGSGLCVWAEDSRLPPRASKPRGRRPATPRPRRHPFACAPTELDAALRRLCPSTTSVAIAEREACTLLPSFGDGPQRSPHLLRADDDERASRQADRLDPWIVPAAGLDSSDALEVLLGLPADDEPGIAVGDSLRFLAEAAKLALELVARGRVLPTLVRRDDRWLARWQPVVTDPADSERLRLLAESMPPLLGAGAPSPEHGAPADVVVAGVLGTVVDACARRFLAGRLAPRGRRRPRTAVEAWLASLTSERDGVEGAQERELAALAEQLEAWREAIERYAAHRTFRTCFRLSAPDEPAEPPADPRTDDANEGETSPGPWRVEILLQAKDDPSVLVPAEDVWRSNGDGLRVLGRRIEDPQERLLGGLGHALRLWPALESALQARAPTSVELDADGAFRFLREAVPELEQAGFGVLAPAWWSRRLRLKLKAEPFTEWEEGSGLFSLDGLCAYEWRIAVGDASLSVAELRELAALKLPLVAARGQWIVLRPEDVEAALKFFEGRAERGEAQAAELLRDTLALGAGRDELPPAEIEAAGWLGELLSANGERKLELVATPASFDGELRPYQQRGLAWLSFLSSLGLGACLADDMGLGKTPRRWRCCSPSASVDPATASVAGVLRRRC